MRDRKRQAARQARNDRDTEGRELVDISDRARENRQYVRTLLRSTQPEFAALLDWLERELLCPGRPVPASATPETGASTQARRGLTVMTERPRRAMLVENPNRQ
jgi:hypothetical protein